MTEIRSRRRICFFCVSLRAGGTERIVSRLANHLVTNNDVHIILLTQKESFYELDPAIMVWQFAGRGNGSQARLYYLLLAHFVRSTIRTIRPDVALVFGEEISPFIRLALIGLAKRIVVLNRGSPYRSLRGVLGWVSPLVFPFTSAVVVQTEQSKRILEKSRYRFCRFKVIPNPIELPSKLPDLDERPKVVINVGFIGRQKNQIALLRAFSLSDTNNEWELHFVGDGPDRPHLEAVTEQMGMSDRVRFLGERQDVPELLRGAQVFAFTSLSEGFPNALAEGLAHGCACISYDCPTGPSDLISSGVNGLLVPMGDERLFAEELRFLLNDTACRLALGMEAKRSMQRFSSERVLRLFEELLMQEDL